MEAQLVFRMALKGGILQHAKVVCLFFNKEHSRNRIGTEMERNKCGTKKELGNKVGTNDKCLLRAPRG